MEVLVTNMAEPADDISRPTRSPGSTAASDDPLLGIQKDDPKVTKRAEEIVRKYGPIFQPNSLRRKLLTLTAPLVQGSGASFGPSGSGLSTSRQDLGAASAAYVRALHNVNLIVQGVNGKSFQCPIYRI
jgi:hypothetical protein